MNNKKNITHDNKILFVSGSRLKRDSDFTIHKDKARKQR
jgi:hypothetical protein